nr:hypothetical protein HULAa50H9_00022 [Candidatus Nanopelagicales bacterium]
MTTEDFSPIWEFGTIPLRTAAAFSVNAQLCPSPLLGQVDIDQIRFEIPNFQRGLVWSKKKKKQFLNSLIQGWPTGAIVLTKIDSKDLTDGRREFTWHVIDGQQRLSTFAQFRESFWSEPWYVDTDEMQVALRELAETLSVAKVEDVSAAMNLLTQGDLNNPFSEEFLEESMIFLAKICRFLGVDSPTQVEGPRYEKAMNACKVLRFGLRKQKEALDAVPIAVITISPKLGVKPRKAREISSEIFTALNSGIPLSKYDLLAAKWVGAFVPWQAYSSLSIARSIEDSVMPAQKKFMLSLMRNRIETSYQSFLEETDMDTASIEELGEEEVSLFDFLYALSKSTREYATKVNQAGTFSTAERQSFPGGASSGTIAFDTCSLLFSGSLGPSGIESLLKLFPLFNGDYDIGLVSEHYLDAAKEIDSKLMPFTKNGTKNKKHASLGAIQATVYLAAYMNTVHDAQPGESDRLTLAKRSGTRLKSADGNSNFSVNQRKSNFRENIAAWWLLHTISDVFQGSDAYKQASQHVWTQFEVDDSGTNSVVRSVRENDFLLYQPSLLDYSAALRNLFIKEFRVSQAPLTRSPSQSALALFYAAYKAKNHEMHDFDMDHVVAYRAQRNATQARLELPIPLNHVANWLPLNPTLNRRRQNTPWAQFFPTMTAAEQNSIAPDLFISVNTLDAQTLNSLENFAYVMYVRFGNMTNAALMNVGLNEYIEKSRDEKISYICNMLKEINLNLSLDVDLEKVRLELAIA